MRVLISSISLVVFMACSPLDKQPEQRIATAVMPQSQKLMLTESQIKLGNISTRVVDRKNASQTLPVNARLAIDEELTEVISARITGRIEKLYIKEPGRTVIKGEPLYELYSETLLTLQREYVLALEQYQTMKHEDARYGEYLKSARRKLILYGLTDAQINALTSVNDIRFRVTFLATASGVINEIKVAEGQYVNEGDALYQLENIKTLWVEAELYPAELRYVKPADQVTVQVIGDDRAVSASVIFISPEYRTNTQLTVLRAVLNNPASQWKPGMQAQVFLKHDRQYAIAIPVDAVIHDQHGAHVYVQTNNHTFEPRRVKTGMENTEYVEVVEGLQEGEQVVVSGAYLLYSELILKNGSDPMLSHHH